MLREEHMDLFGSVNTTDHTYSVDASIAAAITGNIVRIDPKIPHWDAKIFVTESATGTADKINLVVKASNEIASNGAALVNDVTLSNTVINTAAIVAGKLLYDGVLPKGYKYFQFNSANNGAFTAGKIAGICFPEFN